MSNDLFDTFLQTIQAYHLVQPDDKILVAVSGGPDSIVLWHLLMRLEKRQIGIFHLNHCLRPSAAKEAEFVRKLAEELGVAHHMFVKDINQHANKTRQSVESAAREVRYQLMGECLAEHGYSKIALGHHRDDQAETVLMHLLRGTGLGGLQGMAPQRGPYIRPLLQISKEEILAYCIEFNLPYTLDESNASSIYARNKIRLELIPLLEQDYNPGVRKHLANLSEIVRADNLELSAQTKTLFTEMTKVKDNCLYFERKRYNSLSVAFQRRILQECIKAVTNSVTQVELWHIEQLRDYISNRTNFQYLLPSTTVTGSAKLILFGTPSLVDLATGTLEVQGELVIGNWVITTQILSSDLVEQLDQDGYSEDFDLATLQLPLVYRTRQPGDRMQVFGQTKMKKIKDLLIAAKVPNYFKDQVPIICDQEGIIMVCGVRRSEKGRITAKTTQVLRITARLICHCHTSLCMI